MAFPFAEVKLGNAAASRVRLIVRCKACSTRPSPTPPSLRGDIVPTYRSAIGARWEEINLADQLWTIPGERMKAGKEHRVPLSASALAFLETMRRLPPSPFATGTGQSAT